MRNLATVLVTDKESGQSAEVQLDELTNLTNSVVMLSVGPDEIASIEAQSGDLLITLNSGEAIIIAGFFDTPEGERNELVLEDANGILWWGQYDSPWSEFSFAEINLLDEAAKDQEIGWWLIAAGLGAAAAIAAAAGGGGGGGSSSSSPSRPEEDTTLPDAPSAWFNETGDAISGEAEPGSTVIVRDEDGNELGRTTADEDGSYTVELDEPLTNGEEVEVTATDEAGNESEPTTATAPDTTAPDAPTAEFNDTGDAVSGEAEPGSTVIVRDEDGNELGRTTADEDGSYTVELDEPLTNGEEVEVTATDEAGNESETTTATAPDTTAPDAPTAEFNDTGDAVSGEAEPGSTVIVRDEDGNELGRTTADEDGSYTVELDEPLTNGEEVEVTATDEAGNESEPTTATAPDTTAPDAPVITGAVDDVEPAGDLADGDVTNDSTPTLEGTAEADSTVTLFQDGTEIGTTTADGDGNWSFEVPALTDDTFVFTSTATDAAGNISADSAGFTLTIDTLAPDAPTLELANDTGDVDGVTSDGTVNVGGLEENATWEYSTDGGDSWTEGTGTSFVLPEGDYAEGDVLARQTDAAGNTSDNGELGAVSVDTTSPGGEDGTDAPVLAIAEADNGFINAEELADGIQAVVTLTEGTQEGDTVTVTLSDAEGVEHTFEHSVTAAEVTAGEVEMDLTGPFAEGDASAVAVITDEAGNRSADSNEVTFEIDTLVSDAPTLELANDTGDVDGVTSDGTVNVGGLEENATWEYSTDGGASWTEGTGDSFVLPEGDYAEGDVLARQTDEAGNTSDNGELGAVSVDTTSPGGEDGTDAPVLAIAEADNGFINAEELADGIQAVVTLTDGTQEGDTVTVTLTDAEGIEHSFEHTVTAGDLTEGEVSLTLDGDFAEGDASAVAVITDEAGNSSADSNAVAFELDATAPAAPTLELANDTGDVDGVTSDGTVSVGGLEEGATWEYSTDGGDTWIAGTGDSFVLLDGEYVEGEVLARQTDEAGNLSDDGILEMGVTVEGSTPTITIDTIADDDVLNLEESQEELAIIDRKSVV